VLVDVKVQYEGIWNLYLLNLGKQFEERRLVFGVRRVVGLVGLLLRLFYFGLKSCVRLR
jgi:hypothetical protein